MDGFLEGKFSQAVQDSRRNCAEVTGCVGALFADVLQLLSLFPEYSKFKAPLSIPDHFHIQEMELFVHHDFNLVLLRIWGEVLIIFPYFSIELELLISH